MSDIQHVDSSAADDKSVDVAALALMVWHRRMTVAVVTLAALLVAVIYLHFTSYLYTATLNVTPTPSTTGSGAASKLGGLGSLASIAGISLPTDQGGLSFQLYLEGLHSRFAADALAKDQDLMHTLYASEWDSQNKSWVTPSGPLRAVSGFVKSMLGIPNYGWTAPDGARLQLYLVDAVHVSQDPKTPVVTITYKHRNPQFAVRFLTALNNAVDSQLRRKALFRSAQNVEYLSNQLKVVTQAEQREAIIQSLSEQERSAMMANSIASYAVDTFGVATASYRPTDPQPLAVLGISIVSGLIAGVAAAFFDLAGILRAFLRRGLHARR